MACGNAEKQFILSPPTHWCGLQNVDLDASLSSGFEDLKADLRICQATSLRHGVLDLRNRLTSPN